MAEAKTLRKEIKRIAADYDLEWQGELENLASMSKYSSHHDNNEMTKPGPGLGINIDKTINEAAELAEETKERAQKAKDAERKGEVLDERSEKGRKAKKVADEEAASAQRGKERAKKVIERGA